MCGEGSCSRLAMHFVFLPRVREEQILPVLKNLTGDEDADVRYFSDEALTTVNEMK